jgi:hypothetical protein
MLIEVLLIRSAHPDALGFGVGAGEALAVDRLAHCAIWSPGHGVSVKASTIDATFRPKRTTNWLAKTP